MSTKELITKENSYVLKTNQDGKKIKLMPHESDELWTRYDMPVAKCKDTGNGYIFKFPSWSCVDQDNYVCLNYAEAEYIRLLLNEIELENNK